MRTSLKRFFRHVLLVKLFTTPHAIPPLHPALQDSKRYNLPSWA